MKAIIIMLFVLVLASSVMADTITMDFTGTNWSLVSTPQIPMDSRAAYNWDSSAPSLWTGWLNTNLCKYDPVAAAYTYFDYSQSESFDIKLGEGCNVRNPNVETTKSYECFPDGIPLNGKMTDMWIFLPGKTEKPNNLNSGGWHLIGNPFNHNIPFDANPNIPKKGDNILFTDGKTVKTWAQAVSAYWVVNYMTGRDSRGEFKATYNSSLASVDTYMKPGYGYWILTRKDNLAMIIPGDQKWDPGVTL